MERTRVFGCEVFILADDMRTVAQIGEDFAVTLSPAPIAEVAQYLATMERLSVISDAADALKRGSFVSD